MTTGPTPLELENYNNFHSSLCSDHDINPMIEYVDIITYLQDEETKIE